MDIKAFIRELLFGYDCVIVPGFGGFIGNYSSAMIDRRTGTFRPPQRQITFNRNLDHNDGLLIGKISKATGLHYGDSRRIIEDFVRDIKNRLAKGERVVFDHLGSFRLNHENIILFEPESNINYYLGAYGLESFHLSHHKGYDVRKRVHRHIDRDPVSGSSLRKNLIRAAIMIPIITLLVIVPLKDKYDRNNEITSVTLNPLVTAEFENNRNEIDSDLVTVIQTTEEISPDDNTSVDVVTGMVPEADKHPPVVTSIVSEETTYYIITGSFKSEENALSHMEMLREEGFDPEIIRASNGFFRVNAMKCSNIETAVSKKDSLSRKFPGVWITRKRPI